MADEGNDGGLSAAIAAAWEQSRPNIVKRVTFLEETVAAALTGALGDEQRREAEGEAHKLAGSLGTFGFPEGSRLAREVELLLQGSGTLAQAEVLQLSELVLALTAQLEHATEPSVGSPAPAEAGPTHKRLLVVDCDIDLAQRIVEQATAQGYDAEAAATAEEARAAVERRRPDVVVLEPNLLDGGGLRFLGEVGLGASPIPVAVFTAGGQFADRVEVARLGGRRFLAKPISPREVVDAATQVLEASRPPVARVLAVDDDPTMLAALQAVLDPGQFDLTTLDEPGRFWEVLEQQRPDAVVLDAEMPGLNGVQLCRVLRNDPGWSALPVLFLTANTSPQTVEAMFAAGADDYVPKPITGPELVTRLRSRVERARLQRRMGEVDGLTGLPNRRALLADGEQLFALARRNKQPVAVALVELDRLPELNQRYGYDAGDDALRALARLLRRSFSGEDAAGMWQGGRAVILMFGLSRLEGLERLARVLEAYREEDLGRPDWRLSFSAGVAEFPADGSDLAALVGAAEPRLAEARAAGGDRITATAPESASPVGEKVDVVLVDDDETLGALLLHALDTRGWTTSWVQDGALAAELLTSGQLQARALLLDVGLPGLDGHGLLRQLRDHGTLATTRVIMVTLRSSEAEILEALELGAFDHVAKPFSVPVLLHRVRRALETLPS